jgi:26S proteasome regulatory subunit N5
MASGKASGGELEEKIDLSIETSTTISNSKDLVKDSSNNLSQALALLASVEKKARVGNDLNSLLKICETSLELCIDCKNYEILKDTLLMLTSRRSQKLKAIECCVNQIMPLVCEGYAPVDTLDKTVRDDLLVTLRDITDGKIFLEAQRARLTRALAVIKEQDGDIAGAANVLQEVHVETYGSISKKEKVEFILEQMRLTLCKKDYVRAAIVGNKINQKALKEEGMKDHRVKYFELMVIYHNYMKDAFALSKDYHEIYLTKSSINGDFQQDLQHAVLFLILAEYSNEQQHMLHVLKQDSNIESLGEFQTIINMLLTKEIIVYPLKQQDTLVKLPAFMEMSEHWNKCLRTRIIQHNIRVVAGYYQRIQGSRLAQLLGLNGPELEQELSNMVSDGQVYAKIDRPNDVIRFKVKKSSEKVLTDWAEDLKELLTLVDRTSHLIQKEKMTK